MGLHVDIVGSNGSWSWMISHIGSLPVATLWISSPAYGIGSVNLMVARLKSNPSPCAGPPGRGNCVRTGRGLSPVQTLLRLATGEGAGDWVGDVTGLLLSCEVACGRQEHVAHQQQTLITLGIIF